MTAFLIPLAASSCNSKYYSIGGILLLLIGGIVIGLLGKFLAPGSRDNIPLWLTIVCGIGGMLIGNYIYTQVFNGSCSTSGIDWMRHLTQVVVAAILVVIAASLTARRGTRTRV